MSHPQRILVYGVTGSGKSILALQIGEALGLPVFHVDDMAWKPGWVTASLDEQRQSFGAICESDAWVLDSAYSQWVDLPLARVELIVGLDYPRWISFGRLVARSVRRVRTRELVCNGNVETWRRTLSRDSILLWHFKALPSKRERMRQWERDLKTTEVKRFRHPREAEEWLATLRQGRHAADR